MTDNTLLYCLEKDGKKIYILGALDSSFLRPHHWESDVRNFVRTINPGRVITPYSLQDCYQQYAQDKRAIGAHRSTINSDTTESIVLRALLESKEQDNSKEYRFHGLMSRPQYYGMQLKSFARNTAGATLLPHLPSIYSHQWDVALRTMRLMIAFASDKAQRFQGLVSHALLSELTSGLNATRTMFWSFLEMESFKRTLSRAFRPLLNAVHVAVKFKRDMDKRFPVVSAFLDFLIAVALVMAFNAAISSVLSLPLLSSTARMVLQGGCLAIINSVGPYLALRSLYRTIAATLSLIKRLTPFAQPAADSDFAVTEGFFQHAPQLRGAEYMMRLPLSEALWENLKNSLKTSSTTSRLSQALSSLDTTCQEQMPEFSKASAKFFSKSIFLRRLSNFFSGFYGWFYQDKIDFSAQRVFKHKGIARRGLVVEPTKNTVTQSQPLDLGSSSSEALEQYHSTSEENPFKSPQLKTEANPALRKKSLADELNPENVALLVMPTSQLAGKHGFLEQIQKSQSSGDCYGWQLKPCLFRRSLHGDLRPQVERFDSLEKLNEARRKIVAG